MQLPPSLRRTYIFVLFIGFCSLLTGCRTLDAAFPSRVPEKIDREIRASENDTAFAEPLGTVTASGSQYNVDNAYQLARICYLAWQEHKGAVEKIAKDEWGMDSKFVELKETDTQYVIIGDSNFTAIAFRATQSRWLDIWTALKNGILETPDSTYSVYENIPPGHAGFRAAAAHAMLNGVVADLEKFRKQTGADAKNSPVFITGHSLGGAIALLIRPSLDKMQIPVDSVYVFGAPVAISNVGYPEGETQKRYCDTTFLHRFNGTQHAGGVWKTHEQDNVPRLRPSGWHYKAPGTSFELNNDGKLTAFPSYNTIGLLKSAGWSYLWLGNKVTPHNLKISYLPALRRAAAAHEMPPAVDKWWRQADAQSPAKVTMQSE